MRALVQRVSRAAVTVTSPDGGGEMTGAIERGLAVLIGVTHADTAAVAAKMAKKIWTLRILDDDTGVMNRSLDDVAATGDTAAVLVVSQFTLYGDTSGGRRPSWIAAARPEQAEPLVDQVVAELRDLGAEVATGRFRTEMQVSLVNDGPVTLMIEI